MPESDEEWIKEFWASIPVNRFEIIRGVEESLYSQYPGTKRTDVAEKSDPHTESHMIM